MIQFIAIDPTKASVEVVSSKDLIDLFPSLGLERHAVDHGCLHRYESGESINIVVGEHGLFKPADEGRYFSIGNALFEGGAVIYAADEIGDTCSIRVRPPVMFYRDHLEVERAIDAGSVLRPEMAVNGQVIWSWPDPQPKEVR